MLRRFFVFAIAFSLAILPLVAQFDSGQISGYVRDSSLAVIAGATITIINEGSNDQRNTTTNSNGFYVIPNLPVGKYTVAAEVAGFKKTLQTGVVLDAASKVNVDLTMTVGAVSESVEVQASSSQVQTESARITPVCSVFLKPATSAATVYFPTGRFGIT